MALKTMHLLDRLEEYERLGWNFGDAHLRHEEMVGTLQASSVASKKPSCAAFSQIAALDAVDARRPGFDPASGVGDAGKLKSGELRSRKLCEAAAP
jgi:hypothetical protein